MSEFQKDQPEAPLQIGLLENATLEVRAKLAARLLGAEGSADDLITELAGALGKNIELKTAEPREGEPETVTAKVSESTDAKQDKLAQLKQSLTLQYNQMDIQGNKPSFEQVMKSLGNEKLEVADTYDTPYLLPLYKMDDTGNTTGVQFCIAEGKQEMEPYTGDNLRANLEDRIAKRWDNRGECESGMTRVIYKPLFEAAKKAGKPIDVRFWTMLDGDYKKGDPYVPIARSCHGRPFFSDVRAVYSYGDGRFRSAVMGDVLAI